MSEGRRRSGQLVHHQTKVLHIIYIGRFLEPCKSILQFFQARWQLMSKIISKCGDSFFYFFGQFEHV